MNASRWYQTGFSPEINVCTDPRFGRTQENFGSDAQHVAAMGVALTVGLQGGVGDASTPAQYLRGTFSV